MTRFVEYTSRFQGVRSHLTGLPGWARGIVLLAALPGLVLLSLSILAVLVSIAALLLLAVPAYRLMQWVTGTGRARPNAPPDDAVVVEQGTPYGESPGRKRVEATVIDPTAPGTVGDPAAVDRAAD